MAAVVGTRRLRREDPALLTGEARFVDDLRDARTDAPQLRMAEGIAVPRFGEEFAVGRFQSLRHADDAPAHALDRFFHTGEKLFLIERNLGEQQNLRRFVFVGRCQTASGCNPARVAAHHFHDENLRRS